MYQKIYRINQALQKHKEGEIVVYAEFDSGYELLSGFMDSLKK